MPSSICVVGSINMDLVVRAPRPARPGETVIGGRFERFPGGKGANQAVTASRMGGQVSLVGRVGDDDWGSELRALCTAEGIDIHHVQTREGVHTGVGVITVLPDGGNSIVVAPGANALLTAADVDAAAKEISQADVLVLQCEVPAEANARAVELAGEKTVVLLNAAPAQEVPPEYLKQVNLLVVNRVEASTLVGDLDQEISPAGLARRLASLGPDRVVVTLGAQGAVLFNGEEVEHFDGFAVDSIDQTAAGDAFVGALAVLRSESTRLKDPVRHGCAAGALATTVKGAVPSLPTREQVDEFLSSPARVE
jgi:ribokinase